MVAAEVGLAIIRTTCAGPATTLARVREMCLRGYHMAYRPRWAPLGTLADNITPNSLICVSRISMAGCPAQSVLIKHLLRTEF